MALLITGWHLGQASYGLLYAAPRREQIYSSALNRCVSWIQRTRFILFHPFSL